MRELDAVPVPEFDFAAIQQRARNCHSAPKRGRVAAIATLSVLLPALAAAAAMHFRPALVIETPAGRTEIYAHTKDVRAEWKFTKAWQRHIARGAPYRVVWPSHLPNGITPALGLSFGRGAMFLSYKCRTHRGFLQFIITAAQARNTGGTAPKLPMQMMLTRTNDTYDWRAGAERVRLQTNCLTASQLAAVKASMIAEGALQK